MLRVGLSPLNSHKFNYIFQNVHEFCAVCGCTENLEHYLLSCISYRLSRGTMFNAISPFLNKDLSTMPKSRVVYTLLYGAEDMTYAQNTKILNAVIKFIIQSKRLETM